MTPKLTPKCEPGVARRPTPVAPYPLVRYHDPQCGSSFSSIDWSEYHTGMDNVDQLAGVLGRFHLVLLHLPIGLLLLLAALELMALNRKWSHATSANRPILTLAAPAAVLTAASGWLLAASDGYSEELIRVHRWTGVGVAVSACALWWVHRCGRTGLYRGLLVLTTGLTVVAGHFGGAITHGRGFLFEPVPAGPVEEFGKGDPGRGTVRFATVQPVVTEYCGRCHGPDKSKGGLRLDAVDHVLAGGESGPAVVAFDPEASRMLMRMTLPLDHEDHMPPEGKSQPSPEDIELIRGWILSGAVD